MMRRLPNKRYDEIILRCDNVFLKDRYDKNKYKI